MYNAGNGTIIFEKCPSIRSFAAVAGKKEGEGPFGKCFDMIEEDDEGSFDVATSDDEFDDSDDDLKDLVIMDEDELELEQ